MNRCSAVPAPDGRILPADSSVCYFQRRPAGRPPLHRAPVPDTPSLLPPGISPALCHMLPAETEQSDGWNKLPPALPAPAVLPLRFYKEQALLHERRLPSVFPFYQKQMYQPAFNVSMQLPPLIRTPCLAAAPIPPRNAIGIDTIRPDGQAATRIISPRKSTPLLLPQTS